MCTSMILYLCCFDAALLFDCQGVISYYCRSWEKDLGNCLSRKAHSNGSNLVVKLKVDYSREVDIFLQNS